MKSVNKFILFVTLLVFGASCIKEVDVNEGITNNERTIVKLPQAVEELYPFALDAVDRIDTIKVLEVRRDVVSNAELNTPLTVRIAENNGAITAYNTANGTALKPFTTYTLISDNGVTKDGANYVVPFAAGEFVKFIKIAFNTSKLDLSSRNAMAFKIADAGTATISANQEVLAEIAIKNKYDGVYSVEGTLVDYAVSTITAISPVEIALVTTGSNSVKMYDYYWPGDFHPILSGTSRSVYGSFCPLFKFDENDNVIEVSNSYGTPANTRLGQLDPSGVNKYDAATKKLTVKYRMLQSSVITAPPHIRTLFDEVMTYVGPR
jgi:hypothetical protein